jgi:hypothetical protein
MTVPGLVRLRTMTSPRASSSVLVLAMSLAMGGCQAKSDDVAGTPASSAPTDSLQPIEPAGAGPTLSGTPPIVQPVLPASFEEALIAAGGSFVTVTPAEFSRQIVGGSSGGAARWGDREAPFAVLADFDGNGRRDAVLLQRSPSEGRVVAVLNDLPKPRLVELRRWARADAGDTGPLTGFYLRLHPPGTLRVPDFGGGGGDTTVTLTHEGVEVVAYGQAARTYWYADGDFTSLTTAD